MIEYIDRSTGRKEKEMVAGEPSLRWAYETKLGRLTVEMIGKSKAMSSLYGFVQKRRFTRKKIAPFVEMMKIDMTEAILEKPEEYSDFNDFFVRQLKPSSRIIDPDPLSLVSPSDGRILVYPSLKADQLIQVKGKNNSIKSLLGNSNLSQYYLGGAAAVIRLAPCDYHRFHFPVNGVPGESRSIKGYYYSVNPYALKKVDEVYCRNKRMITEIHIAGKEKLAMIEVGATMVGSIVQTYYQRMPVNKGSEKGYFQFGGSTIILLTGANTIEWHEDLIENTQSGYETFIKMGEAIATLKK
ncbi:phosphatidylserine decarboxylase [Tindallia magadiensis]|uniref:phosphatidylserine decarboxylase n=1 Tax=Tindallia magadiensis TaxID=69895 RepID=A0A1I3FB65_9FIRM|nr:phosphatidylserine decarboxylase [Tindallia magadiensis]SFI08412.1 phosphatidylserine decarboxylase [Tindallia magadiensis]